MQHQMNGEHGNLGVTVEYCLTHGRADGFKIKIQDGFKTKKRLISEVVSCTAYMEMA